MVLSQIYASLACSEEELKKSCQSASFGFDSLYVGLASNLPERCVVLSVTYRQEAFPNKSFT